MVSFWSCAGSQGEMKLEVTPKPKLHEKIIFFLFFLVVGDSGYHQIPIHSDDQSKTTFTCPYGTYAYHRMSFRLCDAPASFQRCMMSIFSDMIEEIMKVFMNDFSIYGKTFGDCLENLDKVL